MRSWESRVISNFLEAISKYWEKLPSHMSSRSRSRYSSNRFTRSMVYPLSVVCAIVYTHFGRMNYTTLVNYFYARQLGMQHMICRARIAVRGNQSPTCHIHPFPPVIDRCCEIKKASFLLA